jgi:hypothetical protein
MPRYYMQVRHFGDQLLDPEGSEHADMDALRKNVLIAARSLLSEDVKDGVVDLRSRIDVEDPDGVIVYTLGFAEALKIIPDDSVGGSDEARLAV